jgi:integrative and conjugative element protein (TIGR02256 family)
MRSKLWVAASTYAVMCNLGERVFPLETGGMLVGYTADNDDTVVTAIVGPGPKAKHRRYRFHPDADFQQAELTAHHLRTQGRETYLGDWHTHPKGNTKLSNVDRRTLARIALTPASGTATPVMAILAGGPDFWTIAATRFLNRTRKLLFNSYHLMELTPTLFR